MSDRRPDDNVPLPQLMRAARDVYRDAVSRALADAGCDDIPRSGLFMLAELDQSEPEPRFSPQSEAVEALGLSKQAASQLIDTLVLREYLERRVDPDDRRRMGIRLTDRGRTAAVAVQTATDTVDATIARRITAGELHGLRAGLAAYRLIGERPGA